LIVYHNVYLLGGLGLGFGLGLEGHLFGPDLALEMLASKLNPIPEMLLMCLVSF